MPKKKHTYRSVTIYIRDDETVEQYMKKARDGYYLEDEMKKLMSEPRIPFDQVLQELEVIHADELAKQKQKKPASANGSSTRKKK